MLRNSIHSHLILLESAIFQGRKDGRIDGIKESYGELMIYLESKLWFKVARALFRKRWNLKGGRHDVLQHYKNGKVRNG